MLFEVMKENFVLVRIIYELQPVILPNEEPITVCNRFEYVVAALIENQAICPYIDIWLL